MKDRRSQDIAGLISSVYRRTANRDEFIEEMNKYPYQELDNHMLFALCNETWHGGYIEGIEEE